MSFIKKYSFIIYGILMSLSNTSAEVEMDFFYGEAALRSPKNMICRSDELKHECRLMCGANNYGCIFDECVCLDRDINKVKPKEEENLPPSKKEIKILLSDFDDLIEVLRSQSSYVKPLEENDRPVLRHHIAHFCSDLKVARKCIHTCMKLGKPAFCGKDHNCYCGHKYNSHSKDEKIDVSDTYAKFRDLYTKYFGAERSNPIKVNDDWY